MSTSLLCQAAHSQLLIVDVQQRLAEAMDEDVLAALVKHTGILIEAANALQVPVLHSEQYPRGLGPTLPAITDKLTATQHSGEKTGFSCCAAPGLQTRLNDAVRTQIILTGMEAHICVLQTAIELQQRGKTVFVVEDAVCSRRKKNFKNALARLRQAGCIVTNTESVLFEWLRDAQHPQFKVLSKLIR